MNGRKFRVSLDYWEVEIETEDEGDALVEASCRFDFMNHATAVEITEDDETEEV